MLAILIVPIGLGQFPSVVMATALIFSMFAMSLDLCWGYTGIANFGHAAYFGIGAFASGMMWKFFGLPWLGPFAGVAASVILAGLVGFFVFYSEIRGIYVALVTLAISLSLQILAGQDPIFFGGETGIPGIPNLVILPDTLSGYSIAVNYVLVFFVFLFALVFMLRLVNSRFGSICRAIKFSEARTKSLGYNTSRHMLLTFMISAGIAGLAGSMYAHFTRIAAPEILGFVLSSKVFVWISIGGPGTLLGAIVGAITLHIMENAISSVLPGYWLLILGIIFTTSVFFMRQGIVGVLLRKRADEVIYMGGVKE